MDRIMDAVVSILMIIAISFAVAWGTWMILDVRNSLLRIASALEDMAYEDEEPTTKPSAPETT